MGMGCGMSMIKYVLFIFNLLCALCGIALLTIGVVLIIQINDIKNVVKDYNIAAIPVLLIAFGGIILIISFFGCCGAIRESHCMTMTYAILLLLLIIGQIIFGAFVLVRYEDVAKEIRKQFNSIWSVKDVPGNKEAINVFQRLFSCCGSDGPGSYTVSQISDAFSSILQTGGVSGNALILPDSCCTSGTTPNTCSALNAYKNGCSDTVLQFFKSNGFLIGIILLCLAGIKLVGFIFACCLANSIRNQERRSAY